ncbi:MAG: translesion DNA synthesis-associated protein ImuA [Gammaproteobacteria bacterium]|nr:translesion DNA synthesis-associated protein ImuA [Gammaproteobacteria bacterium]NIM74703.1 translesion DNA synthesis-associated protein ImuA [Gammaproteobacteria bacterium]NIN37522.1 translesion DNA synthesis-associated protein ImuA [Gammaproteobacteria bacterium]NIO26536.1 translesion DNA synthesis-associated protein ImuA [Gammaproteobacteria bacterium]NIO67088.1 translesion DNA synthesis-associated protein ImuA [Gammaproteobacteria bacterium]
MSAALEALRRHPAIWRRRAPPAGTLATGFPPLDEALPDAGWPMGALTEIQVTRQGVGELRLVMPALAELSGRGRWLAWVGTPGVPYAPALAARGVVLPRVLWVRADNAAEQLWSVEQALRSGVCGAVLAWPARMHPRRLRRLQLAAESGGAWALLFLCGTAPARASPASLRLRVAPAARGLAVEVLKCRGRPGARVEIGLDE